MSGDVLPVDPVRGGALAKEELHYLVEAEGAGQLERCPFADRLVAFVQQHLLALVFEFLLYLDAGIDIDPCQLLEEQADIFQTAGGDRRI